MVSYEHHQQQRLVVDSLVLVEVMVDMLPHTVVVEDVVDILVRVVVLEPMMLLEDLVVAVLVQTAQFLVLTMVLVVEVQVC